MWPACLPHHHGNSKATKDDVTLMTGTSMYLPGSTHGKTERHAASAILKGEKHGFEVLTVQPPQKPAVNMKEDSTGCM